jgi:hypothetical protein
MSSLLYVEQPVGYWLRNTRFSKYVNDIRKNMVPYEFRPDMDRHIIVKGNVLEGETGK